MNNGENILDDSKHNVELCLTYDAIITRKETM